MWNQDQKTYQIQRELNIRKIIIITFIVIFIIALVVLFSLYIADIEFRKWIDTNLLRKEINTEDISTIDLNTDKNNQIFCYDKYIGILNDKTLKLYDTFGTETQDI